MNAISKTKNTHQERLRAAVQSVEANLKQQSEAISEFCSTMATLDDRMQVMGKNMAELSETLGQTMVRTTQRSNTNSKFKSAA